MRPEIRDIVFSYWSPSKEIDEWMYDIASDLFHDNTIRNVNRLYKFLYIEEMKQHIDNQEFTALSPLMMQNITNSVTQRSIFNISRRSS